MKLLKNIPALFLTISVFVVSSCAGLTDAFFLDAKVPDKEKSKVVLEEGIAQYREMIINRGDIESLGSVKQYFEVALRYDPTNQTAKSYLSRIQDYRDSKFRDYVKKAQDLEKKDNRKEEDNYVLAVWVQKASTLNAFDSDVIKLSLDTAPIRKELVGKYLGRSEAALGRIGKNTSENERDKLYLEAFQNITKAVDVEPRHVDATRQRRELLTNISDIMNTRIEGLSILYDQADFSGAMARLAQLRELNKKLSNSFSAKLDDAEYTVYIRWAKWYHDRKEWANAESRADMALSIRRGGDAIALKDKIIVDRDRAEQGTSFDTAIITIDKLIAKKDLGAAQRVVSATSKKATTDIQKKNLGKRRDIIRGELEGLYQRGVTAYREEKFGQAVETLETVISIEADYEQASEYLEKAKAKKRLLEQY